MKKLKQAMADYWCLRYKQFNDGTKCTFNPFLELCDRLGIGLLDLELHYEHQLDYAEKLEKDGRYDEARRVRADIATQERMERIAREIK